MSLAAHDLLELFRLAQRGGGALTQHLFRELAQNIIVQGLADARDGCKWALPDYLSEPRS